jgi:hypothetical protein
MSSFYYGVILWGILIPALLGFVLLFRIISLRQMAFPVVCLVIGALLLLGMLHPFLSQNPDTPKNTNPKLADPVDLFNHSKIFSGIMNKSPMVEMKFFPGILMTWLGFFFFVSFVSRGKVFYSILAVIFILLLCYLVYKNPLWLNCAFLLFVLFLILLAVQGWRNMDIWQKLLLLVFATGCVFLFNFSHPEVLKSLAPFRLFMLVIPVGGLRAVGRSFLMLLPFFLVMASIGADRVFTFPYRSKPVLRCVLFSGVLLLLMLENVRPPLKYRNFEGGRMAPISQGGEVYRRIPFKENTVVLEIPYYFRRRLKNAHYQLNWRFHQNPILNGKVSIRPRSYYRKLTAIIGKWQKGFPTEAAVRKLLWNYSVSYIVIHWRELKLYQRSRSPLKQMRNSVTRRIKNLGKFLEILYEDVDSTLIRIRENFPLKVLRRTYSSYHLKRMVVCIGLKNPPDRNDPKGKGQVPLQAVIILNSKQIKTMRIENLNLELDIRSENLLDAGNKLEIRFGIPVVVEDIRLVKAPAE